MANETSAAATLSALRRHNQRLILDLVRERGMVRRSELAAASGLAKSTVKEVCDALINADYLEEVPSSGRPQGPGRPALELRLARSLGWVLGLDLGADKVLGVVSDLTGATVGTARGSVPENERTRSGVLRQVRACAKRALADAGVPESSVRTTVVGTPGVVEPATGRISLAPQIQDWDGVKLAQKLKVGAGDNVVVEREADLSFLAERAHGAAAGVDNGIFVHLGIGIGCSIMVNGQIYRGHGGVAGEIGYLPLRYGEDAPHESGFGPFEWAAGGNAFARLGREAARGTAGRRLLALAHGDANSVNARIVCRAAAEGDPAAVAVVDRIAERIAAGIAATVCVLNPSMVIIGGGLSKAGDTLLNPVTSHLEGLVPAMPELVLSTLGDEAVALGAVQRAIDLTTQSLWDF